MTGPDLGTLRQIPVTRVRALLEPSAPWQPPAHAGDLLRRALVSALYAVTPQARQEDMLDRWFDPRSGRTRERPYALDAHIPPEPGPGNPVRLQLTLIGLVPDPPLLVAALHAMVEKGLGDERMPHRLAALEVWGATHVRDAAREGLAWPAPARLGDLLTFPVKPPRWARVRLVTPWSPAAWRTQDNWPADLAVPPVLLFDTALHRARRLQAMLGLRRQARFRVPHARVIESTLKWHAVEVQARRKARPDTLAGVSGELVLEGDLAGLVPLLAVAEVVQMGRATTRGHGVVGVEWEPRD